MALPSSGPITLAMIQAEFGGENPISLSEYYRGGAYTTNNNTNVPTSGAISLDNFHGAVKYTPGNQAFSTPGTHYFVVPAGVTYITTNLYAGGGSGSTGSFCGDGWAGGGGGSGGYRTGATLAVTAGETLTVVVGAGGAEVGYPGTCAGHRSGYAGGTSSVAGSTGTVSATGGGGGIANPNAYPLFGFGGAGGSPSGVAGGQGGGWGGMGAGGNNGTGYGTGGRGGGSSGVNGAAGTNGYVYIAW